MLLCGDVHTNPGPDDVIKALRFCHVNARSILKSGRLEELYLELCSLHEFDVIGISESHLDSKIPDVDVEFNNYSVFRLDRNRQGGGVALYVRSSLACVRRYDLETADTEMLWAEITSNHKRILVGVCYRSPSQSSIQIDNFISSLEDSLSVATTGLNSSVILLGDFNDRCTHWLSDHKDSQLGLKLVNLVETFNMHQLIDTPTRNNNLLDLIFTDSPGYFFDVGVLPPIDNLDHGVVYGSFNFSYPKRNHIKRKVWLFDEGNYELLNNMLLSIEWNTFFSKTDNIDVLSDNLTDMLHYFTELCIPSKIVTVRPGDKPGMTSEVRKFFRQAKRLHKRAKRTGSPEHYAHFSDKRREAKAAFRKASNTFYTNISDKLINPNTSQKSYWKLTKMVYGNKVSNGIHNIMCGDRLIDDSTEMAKSFNTYFAEQCSMSAHSVADPLPAFNFITDTRLDLFSTTPEEVFSALSILDSNKAVGADFISNKVLKECAQSLCEPLSRLFNMSFTQCIFPATWKGANVVPLFKKENRHLVSNYRPVSLLSNLSKVMEKVVYKKLYKYLGDNNLLTDKNSGFKHSDSTVNQLLFITQKIANALDDKHDACIVFLDVSKAFDKVWHKGLLFKLNQMGITGNALKWIESYLSDRFQRVVVNGCSSQWLYTNSGVPQGSILGPLFFLVYINDLVLNLECDVHLFADDTSLLDCFDDSAESNGKICRDLEKIERWSVLWKVTFNANKTRYMIITRKNNYPNYPPIYLHNTSIERTDQYTHLGLVFTSNFKWNKHIEKCICKASKRIALLNRVRLKLPRGTLCSLYKSMVLPIIEYCDIIYDNCTVRDSIAIEQVQRRAALVCTGAYRHTSSDRLLAELGWQSLRTRRLNHKLIQLFKITHQISPPYLQSLLPAAVENRYNTRNSTNNSLPVIYAKLSSTRNSFVPSSIKAWNNLPVGIRGATSFYIFKSCIVNMNKKS